MMKKKVTAAHKIRALQILQSYQQSNFIKYYKFNTIEQSIVHRFNLTDFPTIENYLQFLENSEKEKTSLYNNLIPSKKEFYSDGINWESLATHIIPQLLIKVPIQEVRCWVIGCGTGEETYSLAILLNEAISATIPSCKFKIFATEINRSALTIASKGIYSQKISQKVSPERLKQYFIAQDDNFVVSSKLRQNIVFATYNMLEDAGFSQINLICCSDYLIYIQHKYRERVLSTLNKSLTLDGILFLNDDEFLLNDNPDLIKL